MVGKRKLGTTNHRNRHSVPHPNGAKSKNNAMLFIEKMYKLSQVSNFKFNMRKLKTNFFLNLQKIGCQKDHNFDQQNLDVKLCNWIGISIDMATL